jgi:hypothetical protein
LNIIFEYNIMANSGKIELQRIRNCMKDYVYDETSLEQGEFVGDYKFTLINRLDGSNDDTIKVTIDFPTVLDDENTYEKDADGDVIYNDENNDKAHQFIKNLIPHNSTKKGGQKKKQRKTRKTRKTRKNKK